MPWASGVYSSLAGYMSNRRGSVDSSNVYRPTSSDGLPRRPAQPPMATSLSPSNRYANVVSKYSGDDFSTPCTYDSTGTHVPWIASRSDVAGRVAGGTTPPALPGSAAPMAHKSAVAIA